MAYISWLTQNFSKALDCLWEFLQSCLKQSSVVIVDHDFKRVCSRHDTSYMVVNYHLRVLETLCFKAKFSKLSMQWTDLLIRFSAQSDSSHKLRNSHYGSSTFNQVMWVVSRNHTNLSTIPFAFLGEEIFIEDRRHLFHDFLIFCSSFLFRAFKHTSYEPKIETSVLHDIHELNMIKKISFLLQIYFVRLLDITYCFTKVFMVGFKSIINVDWISKFLVWYVLADQTFQINPLLSCEEVLNVLHLFCRFQFILINQV